MFFLSKKPSFFNAINTLINEGKKYVNSKTVIFFLEDDWTINKKFNIWDLIDKYYSDNCYISLVFNKFVTFPPSLIGKKLLEYYIEAFKTKIISKKNAMDNITRSFFRSISIGKNIPIHSYLINYDTKDLKQLLEQKEKIINIRKVLLFLAILGVFATVFWFLPRLFRDPVSGKILLQRDLVFTFSGMSLTLFGGGYVVIPTIQKVIVDGLQWLNSREFADAIAMGQVTPGPIFISAAFIGYKVGGILGAITATIAIFFPPGFLMIFCSRFMDYIKQSKIITAVFKGLRPAVIGMIFSAAYTIGKGMELSWPSILIFLTVLVLSAKFKVNVVYLIPLSGLAGILLFRFF